MAVLVERIARILARLRGRPVDENPWDYADDGWLDDDTPTEEADERRQDPNSIRADLLDDGTP
jgi:hypothetical protein